MIEIYGKEKCPSCSNAKFFCEEKGLEFTYVDIFEDEDGMEKVIGTGLKTVPQIWVDGVHVGGYEAFVAHMIGEL